jgi:hypothetical protein
MHSRLFSNFRNFGFCPNRRHCCSHITNLYSRNLYYYNKPCDGEVLNNTFRLLKPVSDKNLRNGPRTSETDMNTFCTVFLTEISTQSKKRLWTWCLNYTRWEISDFCSRHNIIQMESFNSLTSVQIKLYNVSDLQKLPNL